MAEVKKTVEKGVQREIRSYPRFTWNEINSPGCYVIEATGDLIRIPELGPDNKPHYYVCSNGTLWLTKISDDPYISRSWARMIAADLDLPVNF